MTGSFLKKIESSFDFVVTIFLVTSITMLLGLSVATIVLRWFEISFSWIDPLVRHLVFLSAFLGGTLATARSTHIKIDIFQKYFEVKKQKSVLKLLQVFSLVVTFGILIWLIYASLEFSQSEFEYGKPRFFGIHSGYLVSIIPFGFGLIALRTSLKVFSVLKGEK